MVRGNVYTHARSWRHQQRCRLFCRHAYMMGIRASCACSLLLRSYALRDGETGDFTAKVVVELRPHNNTTNMCWNTRRARQRAPSSRARVHIDACAEGALDAGNLTGGTKKDTVARRMRNPHLKVTPVEQCAQ